MHRLRPNLRSNPNHAEDAYAKSLRIERVAEKCRREHKSRARGQQSKAAQQGHHMWKPLTIDRSQIRHYLLKQNIAYSGSKRILCIHQATHIRIH